MSHKKPIRARVTPEEYQLLQHLRERKPAQNPPLKRLTTGERLADAFAAMMGSWHFIIIQSILLFLWVLLNIVGFI
nr:hypothetical protein [Pleurocapsa sp. PCC 7327]